MNKNFWLSVFAFMLFALVIGVAAFNICINLERRVREREQRLLAVFKLRKDMRGAGLSGLPDPSDPCRFFCVDLRNLGDDASSCREWLKRVQPFGTERIIVDRSIGDGQIAKICREYEGLISFDPPTLAEMQALSSGTDQR